MSLYTRLGGKPVIHAAAHQLYDRLIADDLVARFFDGVELPRQIVKQQAFLTMATGGPHEYTGKDMTDGHAHLVKLGLDDSHVDIVAKHLWNVLRAQGAEPSDLDVVRTLIEGLRDAVLGRVPRSQR